MPPNLALALWSVLTVFLFLFDPAKESRTSPALWVPFVWIFIASSRLPSQWLGGEVVISSANAYGEGNSIDRSIYLLLIVAAAVVLLSRRIDWNTFFLRNLALSSLIAYGLLSVLWSDFPLITFKKWFRDLGIYLAIMVILSDVDPVVAIKTFLRRLFYVIVPLSIVMVKYFPENARQYDWWSGEVWYVGVTTSKNMLGVACLISGLFFFWDTVSVWPNRQQARTRQIILLNLIFIAMTLYLLKIADSATSGICCAIGCAIVLLASSKLAKRTPALLMMGIPSLMFIYLFMEFALGIDIRSLIATSVGRDPTLTGRTHIWDVVLSLVTNPMLGTGYETFWIGPRLLEVWRQAGAGLNHSHNGYLEVYLNLGVIGLGLLGWFLIASYGIVCRRLSMASDLGSLTLALWTILLFYNVTESAFKGQLMFVIFLLVVIVVPAKSGSKVIRPRGGSQRVRRSPKTTGVPALQ